MKQTASLNGADSKQWSSSRLFSLWKADPRRRRRRHQQHRKGGGEIIIRLNPETTMREQCDVQWKPWITSCIREYYLFGSIRIPDVCLGPDILLALQYFGIMTSSPETFTFESPQALGRIGTWSTYFKHRSPMAEWIVSEHELCPTRNLVLTTTNDIEDAMDYGTTMYVTGDIASTFGKETAYGEPREHLPSCQLIHYLFFDNESTNRGSNRESNETLMLIRRDFCAFLGRLLKGVDISFDAERVKITKSGGDEVRCALRAVLRVEPSLASSDMGMITPVKPVSATAPYWETETVDYLGREREFDEDFFAHESVVPSTEVDHQSWNSSSDFRTANATASAVEELTYHGSLQSEEEFNTDYLAPEPIVPPTAADHQWMTSSSDFYGENFMRPMAEEKVMYSIETAPIVNEISVTHELTYNERIDHDTLYPKMKESSVSEDFYRSTSHDDLLPMRFVTTDYSDLQSVTSALSNPKMDDSTVDSERTDFFVRHAQRRVARENQESRKTNRRQDVLPIHVEEDEVDSGSLIVDSYDSHDTIKAARKIAEDRRERMDVRSTERIGESGSSGRVKGVSSGRVEAVSSLGRIDAVSSERVDIVSTNRVEVVSSGRVEDVPSRRVKEVSSNRVEDVSSRRPEAVSSTRVEAVSSTRVEAVSPRTVGVDSPSREAVSPRTVGVASSQSGSVASRKQKVESQELAFLDGGFGIYSFFHDFVENICSVTFAEDFRSENHQGSVQNTETSRNEFKGQTDSNRQGRYGPQASVDLECIDEARRSAYSMSSRDVLPKEATRSPLVKSMIRQALVTRLDEASHFGSLESCDGDRSHSDCQHTYRETRQQTVGGSRQVGPTKSTRTPPTRPSHGQAESGFRPDSAGKQTERRRNRSRESLGDGGNGVARHVPTSTERKNDVPVRGYRQRTKRKEEEKMRITRKKEQANRLPGRKKGDVSSSETKTQGTPSRLYEERERRVSPSETKPHIAQPRPYEEGGRRVSPSETKPQVAQPRLHEEGGRRASPSETKPHIAQPRSYEKGGRRVIPSETKPHVAQPRPYEEGGRRGSPSETKPQVAQRQLHEEGRRSVSPSETKPQVPQPRLYEEGGRKALFL